MKTRWILIPVTCLSMVFCGLADAEGSARTSAPGKGMRLDSVKRPVARSAGQRLSPSRSGGEFRRPGAGAPLNLNRGRGNSAGLGRGVNRDLSGLGNAPLGGLLEEYLYNEIGGRGFDPYEGEKAHAKAYRDAAIANAIVNVVGILATANQPQIPVVAGPPPAPVAPRGYVERQRVLVQEGRTEEYQVWIPEYRIPETGEVVVGHNETRRREIAPVFEEREIWVPAP